MAGRTKKSVGKKARAKKSASEAAKKKVAQKAAPRKKVGRKKSTWKKVTRKKVAPKRGADSAKQSSARESNEKNQFRGQLDRTLIAPPLLDMMTQADGLHAIVIDLNWNHHLGLSGAKIQACRALLTALGIGPKSPPRSLDDILDALAARVDTFKTKLCKQYVFAEVTSDELQQLLENDEKRAEDTVSDQLSQKQLKDYAQSTQRRSQAHDTQEGGTSSSPPPLYRYQSIYKVWPDFDAEPLVHRTVSTIKADAARVSFSATGRNIVWAVVDSGIDGNHEHFQKHRNLDLQPPLQHIDFTTSDTDSQFLKIPVDDFGHGTHVAGIIAGEIGSPTEDAENGLNAVERVRDKAGKQVYESWEIQRIAGMAPECKLLSLKVLDDRGRGSSRASNILAALAYVNELNEFGRNIRVHGVNLSVGYEFEADWFGCGHSPLCVEVDRLVRSGVVVVAAAGNTGFGAIAPSAGGPNMAGLSFTINDPGNAELAITVGSTHRYMPHQYGVSYFSSKGPTGDGRLKPDLVAPGENVMSCAAGRKLDEIQKGLAKQNNKSVVDLSPEERCSYREDSGTSMAAPHVSGAIAAFLSIRPGFIGHPDKVKEIFVNTATDLGRERYFQGHGLVDLMRAIQSV